MSSVEERFTWESDQVKVKRRGRDLTADGAPNDGHTSGMIALVPSEADLDRLVLDGWEPREQLHLTLEFLGEAAEIPDDALQIIKDQVLGTATAYDGPIEATAFAAAMFNPVESPCWVLQVGGDDVAQLHDLTDAIMNVAADTGWTIPEQHSPFCAHITLAYTDDPNLVTDVAERVGPITFDRLRLALGDEVTDYPLGSEATVSDGQGANPMTDTIAASDTVMTPEVEFTTARIRALTLLDVAAFVEAKLAATGPVDADGFLPVAGVAVVEDTATGDGRVYKAGAFRWEEGGYPLRWDVEDDGEHVGSVLVGKIDTTVREGNEIKVTGRVDTSLPMGGVAAMAIERGMLQWVSVDMDDIPEDSVDFTEGPDDPESEVIMAAAYGAIGLPLADEATDDTPWDPVAAHDRIVALAISPDDGTVDVSIVAQGHLYAADDADLADPASYQIPFADDVSGILTAVPVGLDWASAEASTRHDANELTDDEFNAIMTTVADYYDRMAGEEDTEDPIEIVDETLMASAWSEFGNLPPLPAAAFREPSLKIEDEHVHYENGRIYGWVAQNGVCHDAFSGSCVTAPLGSVDLRTFLRQPLTLDDGTVVQAGAFTMGAGHDNDGAASKTMQALFDDTRTVAGIVTVGVNAHGMWFSGVAAPWLSDWDKHVFAACRPSGHWRRLRSGGWSLRAVLSVPTPGFPNRVSRIAASAFVNRANMALAASALPDPVELENVSVPADPEAEYIKLVAGAVVDEMETRARIKAEVEELTASLSEERKLIAATISSTLDEYKRDDIGRFGEGPGDKSGGGDEHTTESVKSAVQDAQPGADVTVHESGDSIKFTADAPDDSYSIVGGVPKSGDPGSNDGIHVAYETDKLDDAGARAIGQSFNEKLGTNVSVTTEKMHLGKSVEDI